MHPISQPTPDHRPAKNLSIRHADTHDVPSILRFIQELAEYEKLSHEVTATEDALRNTLFGSHPTAEILLAEYKTRQPVGFALFFHTYSSFLGKPGIHLEDLYVTPAWRNRGIGRQLLSRIAQLAHARNCGRVEWSVLDWNQDAIRFYQSLGAIPLSEWTTFRVTDTALEQLATNLPPPNKEP